MAHIKSAKKRVLVNQAKALRNKMVKSALKTAIKKAYAADEANKAEAVANAIKKHLGVNFTDLTYEEHALSQGSTAKAVTYMSITLENGKKVWGAGVHDDIIASSINALFSAINRSTH